MKKIITLVAAVVSAALFFSCSDSSDNNNSALLLAASKSSSRVSLPESVGENELAGKTFKSDDGSESSPFSVKTIEFSDSFYIEKTGILFCQKYAYSYNSNSKSLYSYLLYSYYEGESDSSTETTLTADELSELEKTTRVFLYSSYGYTDTTGETEVPAEVIARYERDMSLQYKTIICQAYNLSVDGGTLKLISDFRYPQGTTLQDVYSPSYARDSLSIVSNTSFYRLNYSGQYVWPERNAGIMSMDSKVGYKISSITADVINYSAKGTRSTEDSDFVYDTAIKGSFAYSISSETPEHVTYSINNNETEFGAITITYAASTNIPDMTSATSYTLVTE